MFRKVINSKVADLAFSVVTTAGSYAIAASKLKHPANQQPHKLFTHSKSASGAAMHMVLSKQKQGQHANTTHAESNKNTKKP